MTGLTSANGSPRGGATAGSVTSTGSEAAACIR